VRADVLYKFGLNLQIIVRKNPFAINLIAATRAAADTIIGKVLTNEDIRKLFNRYIHFVLY
jgi:hypothetical protein